MTDIRKFECGENFTPASHLFNELSEEVSHSLKTDSKILAYKEELTKLEGLKNASVQDVQKAETLKNDITLSELNIISKIYSRHNINPNFMFTAVSWELKSSEDLYWTARQTIHNWNRSQAKYNQ